MLHGSAYLASNYCRQKKGKEKEENVNGQLLISKQFHSMPDSLFANLHSHKHKRLTAQHAVLL